MADPTAPKQPWGPFKPGQSGNPAGRPEGAHNKLVEACLEDMLADWEANVPAAIGKKREKKPDAHLEIAASILPRDLPHQIDKRQPFVNAFAHRYNRHRAHDALDESTKPSISRPSAARPAGLLTCLEPGHPPG
ncbi:hypothetical protein FJ973_27940 [Mesorhizobium sp. B2-1-3]|uniref:DUF5681 domain-containing protein n=1 Tax=Mesorhizobium sp. B2-1-3 TaxID=2589972 RepID=UPI0011681E70|nr:DUF5681 domain-containing protein [Mesorhizobium sp. B2-1-3]TPN04802.1 hypothetical protein FJ973_27940 [Mesorhizobium sp. B2-1-3]